MSGGYENAQDARDFWRLVSERLYKDAAVYRSAVIKTKRGTVSLDQQIGSGQDGDAAHVLGHFGFSPPEQIEVVFLNEVRAGIALLPEKTREVMQMLSDGNNALDIAAKLHIPVHTVFHRITEGRTLLFRHEMVGVALDAKRKGGNVR